MYSHTTTCDKEGSLTRKKMRSPSWLLLIHTYHYCYYITTWGREEYRMDISLFTLHTHFLVYHFILTQPTFETTYILTTPHVFNKLMTTYIFLHGKKRNTFLGTYVHVRLQDRILRKMWRKKSIESHDKTKVHVIFFSLRVYL